MRGGRRRTASRTMAIKSCERRCKHKFVRQYIVTNAAVHDSQVVDDVLDNQNTSSDVFGDSAFDDASLRDQLEQRGCQPRFHRRGRRNQPLSERQKLANQQKSKVRARVEHVFGVQSQMAGQTIVRTIGYARAKIKIGLRNLATTSTGLQC